MSAIAAPSTAPESTNRGGKVVVGTDSSDVSIVLLRRVQPTPGIRLVGGRGGQAGSPLKRDNSFYERR